MNFLVYFLLLFLSGLLALVSYVERLYTESGKFLSREFQENIEAFEKRVEPRLDAISGRAALAMGVLVQLATAAIAMILSWLVFTNPNWNWKEAVQAAVAVIDRKSTR